MSVFLCVSSSNAWALNLESILTATTITPPARVNFHEERHNQMLKEPLVLNGYLEYLEEGHLRKVVESPFQEAFRIEGDQIEIQRDGGTKVFAIKKSRSLRAMLVGIEAILAGQVDQLSAIFFVELSGTDDDWFMLLTPRSKRIAKQLIRLQVTGDAEAVTSIRIELAGGEWHQMEIIQAGPVK